MQKTYDHYFSSAGYRRRYPKPNAATLNYLLNHGGRHAARILDFGCGNGRYALALLEQSSAHVIAYDISAVSLAEFAAQLRSTLHRQRVTFVCDDLAGLKQHGACDLILMLFGVLSHLGGRDTRLQALRQMRELICADGQLILSVPSIFRRRPWELIKCGLARRFGKPPPPQDESGNIYFSRKVEGRMLTFFYHLYSLDSLRAELAEAGFAIRESHAESLFPEWWVTQSAWLCRIDGYLCKWLAPALGYGIRVLAYPI